MILRVLRIVNAWNNLPKGVVHEDRFISQQIKDLYEH